jgi:hypothetical protein
MRMHPEMGVDIRPLDGSPSQVRQQGCGTTLFAPHPFHPSMLVDCHFSSTYVPGAATSGG